MVTTINSSNSLKEKSKNKKLPYGSWNERLTPLQPVRADSEQDVMPGALPVQMNQHHGKTQQKSSGLMAGRKGARAVLEHRMSSEA